MADDPKALNSETRPNDGGSDGGDRSKIAALIFLALLVIGGIWLFESLSTANDKLNCVASGRRNCDQIDQ